MIIYMNLANSQNKIQYRKTIFFPNYYQQLENKTFKYIIF